MNNERSYRQFDVLHVIDSLGRSGGAEQQLIANLRRFDDARLRHRILCLYERQDGDSRRREVPGDVEVDHVVKAGKRTRNRLILVAMVLLQMRKRVPDLIHCALPDAALAARVAGRVYGVPVVESLVNISHERVRTTDNNSVTPAKLAAHRLVDRLTMRWVRRFQALSRAVRDSWIEQVSLPPERIVVIPRGVPTKATDSARDRTRIRADFLTELGVDENAFVIVNIGRQVAQKGQIYAIRAMPSILERVPSAVFVSAGSEGGATSTLRETVKRLGVHGSVRWLGVREDVSRILSAGDMFLFPSLYEGLGVSLLEAMAAGLACVTTDRRPMTEVVAHEVNGLLVPAGDFSAIAAASARLADDSHLRSRLAERARADVLAHYDLDDIARRVQDLYLATIGERAPEDV